MPCFQSSQFSPAKLVPSVALIAAAWMAAFFSAGHAQAVLDLDDEPLPVSQFRSGPAAIMDPFFPERIRRDKPSKDDEKDDGGPSTDLSTWFTMKSLIGNGVQINNRIFQLGDEARRMRTTNGPVELKVLGINGRSVTVYAETVSSPKRSATFTLHPPQRPSVFGNSGPQ